MMVWLVGSAAAAAASSSVLLRYPSEMIAVFVVDGLVRMSVRRLVGCLEAPRTTVGVLASGPKMLVLFDGMDILPVPIK